WTFLAVLAVVALVLSVVLGPAAVPLSEVLRSDIVWQLRLPRAVLAFLVGGALGVSGVGLQALVRNPLADPFLLGLSGGAGLGAVVAIAFHLPGPWALPLAAFVGAVGAMALVYRLGLMSGAELDPRILLLGGVAVGAFAAAITTALVSLAEATELRNAFLWLWGGFSGASWTTVLVILVYTPLPLVLLALGSGAGDSGLHTAAARRPVRGRAATRPAGARRRACAVPRRGRAASQAARLPVRVAFDRRGGRRGGRDRLCRADRAARLSSPLGPAASHPVPDRVPRRRGPPGRGGHAGAHRRGAARAAGGHRDRAAGRPIVRLPAPPMD